MTRTRSQGARDALVARAADLVVDAFDDYNARFADITRRARRRFEQRDWAGARRDAVDRIRLYDDCIAETIARLEQRLAERLFSRTLWIDIHAGYAERIAGLLDAELYKTYFNTLTRRLFKTRGVDPKIEFVALDIEPTDRITHPVARHIYSISEEPVRVIRRMLADYRFRPDYASPDGDATALAGRLVREFDALGESGPVSIELLQVVFYRDRRAYLVGRVFGPKRWLPCVIVLINGGDGIRVDAVLTRRRQVSVLFGYTHSYFHADLPTVGDAVVFLRSLLPDKPLDELYTVLGRAKQGKTERYRHFFRHLEARRHECLVEAEGTPGLVMVVFTLPSYPLVFKVIRDRFGPGKSQGRDGVLEQYHLVFHHERVGRLVDAQEYRDLSFPRNQFSEALLEELLAACGRTVSVKRDRVVLGHCFVQRRVRPLNLFVREAGADAVDSIVTDFGQAIKDLARSNIFPGDLFLKNFGVTRSNRVVFYDYDEVRLVTDCHFKPIPPARFEEQELSDETWFPVEGSDVFPEQFDRFIDLSPGQRKRLAEIHGELFDPDWWCGLQERLAGVEAMDVPPYPSSACL